MKEIVTGTVDAESVALDNARWTFVNEWRVESQGDDRLPMNGAVANAGQPASGQRAFARRAHQLRYKQWSKERHD